MGLVATGGKGRNDEGWLACSVLLRCMQTETKGKASVLVLMFASVEIMLKAVVLIV